MNILRGATAVALLWVLTALVGSGTEAQQEAPLNGQPGWNPNFNAAWIDLGSPTDFHQGQKLIVHLMGVTAKKVVARFVTAGCSVADPCSIIARCKNFDVDDNGTAEINLDRDYLHVIQFSVHSGINNLAFFCHVDGGPMPQLAAVDVVTP